MTRTGLSPRLSRHRTEPFVEIHPDDAAAQGVRDGALAKLSSMWGESLVRVRVDDGQQQGSVFVPIHWNDTNSADAVISCVVNPETDPISGQPESKYTPVSIQAFEAVWHALAVTRGGFAKPDADYWTTISGTGCVVTALAGGALVGDWQAWAEGLAPGVDCDWISYADPAGGRHRFAAVSDGVLQAAVFVSAKADLPSLDWVQAQFALDAFDDVSRAGLLAGRAPGTVFDPGPTVCSCFSIGVNEIRRAISENRALSVEAIGEVLQAGTNCGSCIPEIQTLLDQETPTPELSILGQEVA